MIGKVHSGLRQRKGILFDRDHYLDGNTEEEIRPEMESKGKVSVKRFTKINRNGLIEPTNIYLLTFCTIKVRLHQMKIDLFVPNLWNAATVLCGQLDCDDNTS